MNRIIKFEFASSTNASRCGSVKVALHDRRYTLPLCGDDLNQPLMLSEPTALPARLLFIEHEATGLLVQQVGTPITERARGVRERKRRGRTVVSRTHPRGGDQPPLARVPPRWPQVAASAAAVAVGVTAPEISRSWIE